MTSRVLICNKSSISESELTSALGSDSNNCITFDNKYFNVSVELCFDTQVPIEEISETVEAFVFIIDEPESDIKSVLGDVEHVFKDFLSEVDPAVKLVLINTEESAFESEFLEWCVEHEFEFIKYIVSESASEESLMGQCEGIGRVRAALECHMWTYRTMKNGPQAHNEAAEDFGDYVSANSALTDFQSLMEGENMEGDFSSMFSNMLKIKEVAGQLPDQERKRFAEQVAMSFWRAMGGSDDDDGDEL